MADSQNSQPQSSRLQRFTIEGGVCFMLCEPGLYPVVQLYDLLPDGTKRYTVTVGPGVSDDATTDGEEKENEI